MRLPNQALQSGGRVGPFAPSRIRRSTPVSLRSEEHAMDVFVLQHVRVRAGEDEDVKLIGVYSTTEAAQAAVARLSRQPGFRDSTTGFHVDRYTIDKDEWTEGFVTVHHSDE